jgi:hypothetical protein
MRNLVEPPPSTHCERCKGELLFKRIEPDDPAFDIEVQLFVCAKCGREHSRRLIHERSHSVALALPVGLGAMVARIHADR